MEIGKRIIFDKSTGKVLNGTLEEMSGDLQEGLRPSEIDFIDLPYGDAVLKDADTYHVNIDTRVVIIDSIKPELPLPIIPSNPLDAKIEALSNAVDISNDNQLNIMSAIADLYEAITPV